jgi:hypothetical protein
MILSPNATNRVDAKAINNSVDLFALASNYTKLRSNAHHDWQGDCPKCGTDFFHVYQLKGEWRFRCYECHDKPTDAIGFAMWLNGVDFLGAVAILQGNASTASPAVKRQPRPQRNDLREGLPTWAAAKLAAAQDMLISDPAGQPGRDYLAGRGLLPATWQAMGMGFDSAVAIPGTEGRWQNRPKAPAIAIPWYSEDSKLVGVRYRFLTEQNGRKLTAMLGSIFVGNLFGAHALYPSKLMTLVICEGELNAASIAQVAGNTRVDVLSIGSEGGTIPDRMIEQMSLYGAIIAWLDKPEQAIRIASKLPGALARKSVGGKDANDCLKAGNLGGMIAAARLGLCTNDADRLALLWDFYDGGMVSPGLDDGTAAFVRRLAADLGQSVTLQNIGGAWFTGVQC